MAFPKIDACLICEGARPEVLNKHILLGFFGIAPYPRVLLKDFQVPATLYFVFCGGEGEGMFRLKLQLTDPLGIVLDNNALGSEIVGNLVRGRPNTNVFMGYQGVLGKPGKYRISLLVNDVEHYATTLDLQPAV